MPDMPQTSVQPSSLDARPSTDLDTALEIARLQARLSELLAIRGTEPLQPVTFQAFGAGAHRVIGDESTILFSFPVHAGRCVRIAARYDTASAFADSLVETLGGWKAFAARQLKRGARR